VTGLIVAIGLAVPASAHTSLVGIDPAEGSTVAAGDSVTLSFSEALLTIGAEATVTDSAGVATKLDVTFPKPTSAQVTLPSVAGGKLTLAWRVVAGDGHPVEGTLAYVADVPPTSAAPSAGTQTSPSASSASGSPASAGATPLPTASATPILATPSAAPSTGQSGSSGFNNVALWAALFAAILASSIAIVAAKRRR
jgi:copper resistance protein C